MLPTPTQMAGKTVADHRRHRRHRQGHRHRPGRPRRPPGDHRPRPEPRARRPRPTSAGRCGNPAVDVFTADLSAQTEVRRLAAAVRDAFRDWTSW